MYAAISACPVFGGKLQSVDEAHVVRHARRQESRAGRRQRGCRRRQFVVASQKGTRESANRLGQWRRTPKSPAPPSRDFLKEGLDAEQAFVGNQAGDVKSALAGAAKVVEATYSYPYQNHASMEPMNATALYTADRCEVWCSTQNGKSALAVTAEAGRPSRHTVRRTQDVPWRRLRPARTKRLCPSDCHDRQGIARHADQAVVVARRGYDALHYHPITQCKMTAGFDANKNLIAFHMRISGQSILATVLPSRMEKRQGSSQFPRPRSRRRRKARSVTIFRTS